MSHTVCAAAPCARPFVRAASLRSAAARPLVQRVRSDGGQPATSPAANAATTVTVDTLFSNLDIDLDNYRRAPATLVRETASIMIMGRGVSCLPRDGGSACHLPHAPCRAACFPAGVQKQEVSGDVLATVEKLANAGALKKWGAALSDLPERRSVMLGELRLVGVKQPEKIAQLSVRNDAGGDGRGSIERGSSSSRIRACWHWVQHMYLAPPTLCAAFLFSVVGTTSVAAVVLGQLPGDWGFFSSYLIGGISLVVLAIGSINPGILQFAIDRFRQAVAQGNSCDGFSHHVVPHLDAPYDAPMLKCCSVVFPDYKQRVVAHEAAHFLAGYLLRVPVANYSLMLGKVCRRSGHKPLGVAAVRPVGC